MSDAPKITLRYFDARGRAQFLRYYFRHRDIPFVDDRVPMSADFGEWLSMRDDEKRTGPFRKLPVLHWADYLLAEAMVIRTFVHRASGDAATLSEQENLRDEMLASSIYQELMRPIRTLLWAELIFPGLDLPAFVRKTRDSLEGYLKILDRTVSSWPTFAKATARPLLLTDCLLWEELDAVKRIFGDRLTLDETETLARFYSECPGRPTFERMLKEKPCQLSGSSMESEVISKIQEILSRPAPG